MVETCITWLGLNKGDGHREARRLSELHPACCQLSHINNIHLIKKIFFNIIIVGHDDDVKKLTLPQAKDIRAKTCHIVLAACSLAPSKHYSALSDSNQNSVAQTLANTHNVTVTACKRYLTFDEVGKGKAFHASSLIHALLPTEPSQKPWPNASDLWEIFSKQSDIDEITTTLDNIL